MEAVPKDRGKENENDNGKNKIIQKLSYERGYISSCGIFKLAAGIFSEAFANHPVQRIVDQCRGYKGNSTAQKNEPRSAKNAVKGAVVVCGGGNCACHEKDQTGQQVYHDGKQGNAV